MKRSLILGFLIACSILNFAFAGGTITGTLQGHSAGQGYDYFTFIGSNTTYSLPGNTVFEDGAVNGTVYVCTYVGTPNTITSADCKIKTAVVKGKLSGNNLVNSSDNTTVLAVLPSSTTYNGGQTDGEFYLCNYIGTLPNVTSATCSLNSSPTVPVKSDGFRLFPDLSCPDQPFTCFTQAIFQFSQVAIIILAVAAVVIAGIIYMTSSGNPKQIEMAKKLIIGALTGVAVMVLGRLFLTQVLGVAWPWF